MLLFLLAVQATPQLSFPLTDPPPTVYHGFKGQTQATAPRIEDARITIDGRMDEPVWQQAAILTGFSQYSPVDGLPADDSTEVLIWYSPSSIYFGIRAFETHGKVNATLADRDKIDADDRVEILLDTFDDQRLALSFAVNPLGVQADGFRTNAPIARPDFTTDYAYESKGRVTDYGYEVEVRIPFKSLRYQGSRVQDWGLNVIRLVQHSGYEQTWTRAYQGRGPLVSQSGKLGGLTDLKRGLVLDLNPFVLGKVNGAPAAAPTTGWAYQEEPEAGFNARWGVTTNLALDLTYNADFSQVEADAGQIPEDVRFAVQFPEKRPFFLDGIEKFTTLNRLIYTRRIADPVVAARATGKLSGLEVGFISAVDDKSTSATADNPIYNVLRLRRDLGGLSTAGITYTDKIDGGAWNRVAEADLHFVWNRSNFWDIQHAWSFTRDAAGRTLIAPLFETAFDCTGKVYGCRWGLRAIHGDFQAQSGFITRTDYVSLNTINRYTVLQRRGPLLEKLNLRNNTDGFWDFNDFSPTRLPAETRSNFTIPADLRGGWNVTPGWSWRTYDFPQASYTGLAVQRTIGTAVDTVPYMVPPRINNAWTVSLQVTSPQFRTLAFSSKVESGRDINFTEPDRAAFLSFGASSDLRPTPKIRIAGSYNVVRRNRESDGTRFSTQHIPRVKIEYQLSRPVFIRLVGQYNVDQRDALRDPLTGFPLLQRNSSGRFLATTVRSINDLRIDWLFSFRPNPGTVVFFGYGSSLTETDPFAFSDVRRVRDGFFVKLSYLFRV
ncbi:MAG: carbohydrate binding family 9 domain-containing protein [Gemmatimonadetes bacterium]|nr:carbohydrate binding family 9 domain-containing protein [Gemmatimonadota bacterium]